MGFFANLNARISANMRRHGHYLTTSDGAFDNRLDEGAGALAQLARPDARDAVRKQIERIVRANAPARRGAR